MVKMIGPRQESCLEVTLALPLHTTACSLRAQGEFSTTIVQPTLALQCMFRCVWHSVLCIIAPPPSSSLTYFFFLKTSFYYPESVWFRVTKVGNVLTSFYRPAGSSYWYQFGARLSMTSINSNGYYIGIAVTSHSSSESAVLSVESIELTRTCSRTSNSFQCAQSSNCDYGAVSQTCYNEGSKPEWEDTETAGSVLDYGSRAVAFGCGETYHDDQAGVEEATEPNRLTDRSTIQFTCDRTDANGNVILEGEAAPAGIASGIIIKPTHGRMSMAKALRVYGERVVCHHELCIWAFFLPFFIKPIPSVPSVTRCPTS